MSRLIVRNLPTRINNSDFQEKFQKFQGFINSEIKYGQNGEAMVAVIQYKTFQNADYVRKGMQGYVFPQTNQQIQIEFLQDSQQQQQSLPTPSGYPQSQSFGNQSQQQQQQLQQAAQQNQQQNSNYQQRQQTVPQPSQNPPQHSNQFNQQQQQQKAHQHYNSNSQQQQQVQQPQQQSTIHNSSSQYSQPQIQPPPPPQQQQQIPPRQPQSQQPQQQQQFQGNSNNNNNNGSNSSNYYNENSNYNPSQRQIGSFLQQMIPNNNSSNNSQNNNNRSYDNSSNQDVCLFKLNAESTDSLYVEGLPKDASEREVAHMFRPFPGYQSVRFIKKRQQYENNSKELQFYVFIDFENSLQSTIALKTLQGYRFDKDDRKGVKISYAKEAIKRDNHHHNNNNNRR